MSFRERFTTGNGALANGKLHLSRTQIRRLSIWPMAMPAPR